MFPLEIFQLDAESYVTTRHNVLNLKFSEVSLLSSLLFLEYLCYRFLEDSCGLESILLRLGARDHNSTRAKDQGSGPGISYAHNDRTEARGIILSIAATLG